MKKRRLTAALISGFLAAQSLASAIPAAAIGNSLAGLVPADAVKNDPDAVKFRNDEWAGVDYTDTDGTARNTVDIFQVGREDATAQIIPWQDSQSAAGAVWDYNAREKSDYLQMLTGEGADRTWQLNVVTNPQEAAQFEGANGFTSKDFTNSAWKDVTLPCSWTMQGFDFPIYTNQTMPFQTKYGDSTSPNLAPAAPTRYNPVGMYRKSFTLKEGMLENSRRVYINFQGVESAYYVYINGKEVGYAEDMFSPHKFDVTDYLQEGENFLAVKVLKYSDATWMEDQDMIYDGGIFRDVFLTSAPLVQVSDYKVETDLDADYQNATLSVDLDIRNLSTTRVEGWSVDLSACDEEGNDILKDANTSRHVNAPADSTNTLKVSTYVKNPKLWSCEHPDLYALVIRLKDASGNIVETLSTQLGFREIEFTRTQVDANGSSVTSSYTPVTLNGEHLFLKGTDRHDSDPVYGKAVPQSAINEDLKLMKQNNLNAIRTSHYSNDDYLYWLANRWGVYILAETNLECHAFMDDSRFANSYTGIASDYKAKFRNMILDREETAFERLKNNPSVVIWSLGNETARPWSLNDGDGVFKDAMQFFKDSDSTRPVLFESFGPTMGGDIHAEQYPPVETVQSYAGSGRIPYLMSEFVHSMGNSTGHLKEYMDAVRSADNMMGCFIWDWVDQSRYKDLQDLNPGWDLTDAKGQTGTAEGESADLLKDLNPEDTLNAGTAFAGYTVMDQSDAVDAALSGADKSFTLEVNVRPTAASKDNVFITKGDSQVALKTNKYNQIEFYVFDTTWRPAVWDLPSNWVGNWQHLAVTYDRGTVKLYINGEQYGNTQTLSNVTISNSSYKLGIGAETQNNRHVDGQISIARIYSRALSADEIKGQKSSTPAIGKDDPSVVLWVDYSEGLMSKASKFWDYYSSEGAHSGIYEEESKGKFLAYGGDWGDRPNDNSFCANGLVSADRDPQPELEEVKFQYQNLWFTATPEQVAARTISVFNENRFTDLNEYELFWEVLEDGVAAKQGTVPAASLKALETGTISVPYEMPEVKDGCEYLLNVSARLKNDTEWAKAGHELSYAQFAIPADVKQTAHTPAAYSLTVQESDDEYAIAGDSFSFSISKTDGQLKNYVYNSETIIKEGPKPNFWRCLTENDEREGSNEYDSSWRTAADSIRVDSITSEKEGDTQVITAHLILPNADNTKFDIVYIVESNGAVTMKMKVDATATDMGKYIVVGSNMILPEGYENVTWYADGPNETLADRMTHARAEVFSKSVSENFYPYIKVDDTGTLPETRWMRLSGTNSTDVLVVAKNTVQTSALHHLPAAMNEANHPYELTPLKETIVGINYGSKGTGGATCGGATRAPYQLPNQVYEWEFTIVPAAKSQSDISDLYHSYHQARILTVDENADPEVDALKAQIDAFLPADYSQLASAQAIEDAFHALSDSQKAKLSADQQNTARTAVETIRALENKTPYLEDRSSNHLTVDIDASMQFVRADGNGAFTGHVEIGHQDVIAPVFAAGKSWTMESVFVPTTIGDGQKTLISKGDYLTTLRTQNNALSFHISDGNNWYESALPAFSDDVISSWVGKTHTATAVYDYDAGTISIYLDGALYTSKSVGQVSISDARNQASPLCIGIDPLNPDRTGSAQFVSTRLYSKALSAAEISATVSNGEGALTPADSSVVLWLDSGDVKQKDAAPADKTALKAEIDASSALQEKDYSASSWNVFMSALENAQTVDAKADASQYAVNNALDALKKARTALKETIDLSELQDLLDHELTNDGYRDELWDAYQNAINAGRNISAMSSAAEAVRAVEDIRAAISALSSLDTALLDLAGAKAAALEQAKADYDSVPASFSSLAEEIAALKSAASTTQKDVDDKAMEVNEQLLSIRHKPSSEKLADF